MPRPRVVAPPRDKKELHDDLYGSRNPTGKPGVEPHHEIAVILRIPLMNSDGDLRLPGETYRIQVRYLNRLLRDGVVELPRLPDIKPEHEDLVEVRTVKEFTKADGTVQEAGSIIEIPITHAEVLLDKGLVKLP